MRPDDRQTPALTGGAESSPSPTAPTSAACVHVWKFRSDIPVLDFGRLGIRTYECADCGLIADSDPETGEIREPDADEL